MDLNDIFRNFGDIFGGAFGGFGGFGGGRGQRQYRGSDMRMKVRLTLEEISTGVTKKFKVRKDITCNECHGTGCASGHSPETCPTCHGQGYVIQSRRSFLGMMQTQEVCPNCHGEGTVIKHTCSHCHGEGVTSGEEIVEIKIPAGVAEGMVVNVPGKGNAAKRGGVPGDIQVLIEEEPHKDFIRDDTDLIYNLLLTVSQAALGVELTYGSKWKVTGAAGRIDDDQFGDMGRDNKGDAENLFEKNNDTLNYQGVKVAYDGGKFYGDVAYQHLDGRFAQADPKSTGIQKYDNNKKTGELVDYTANIWSLLANYRFDRNSALKAEYANNTEADHYDNAYSFEYDYKGAEAANKGTWGAYVAYRKLGQYAA